MTELGKLPPPPEASAGFGRDPGTGLPDTAMLIYLNASHTRAMVLSIPRDLLVYRPPCQERVGGDAIPSTNRSWWRWGS